VCHDEPADDVTISVAMTTFNGAKHVGPQLESVLDQTRAANEIVVFDDASTDGTWEILQRVASRSSVRVRLAQQPRNVGLRRNVQDALAACNGSVVVLADQDDRWSPRKLATVDRAFRDPNVTVWFSDAELIDERGATVNPSLWSAVHFDPSTRRDINSRRGFRLLLHGMTVTGATMAVRRDVVEVALPLPEQFDGREHVFLHDGWLAVLGLVIGDVVAEPETLTSYRRHPEQLTAATLATEQPTGGSRSAKNRKTRLRLEQQRTALVAERIRERAGGTRFRQPLVEDLFALEEFLGVRVTPRSTSGRRRTVFRELRAGRYVEYARGVRTAIRDLI
jgi:hypothetical protein